ncbi:MAG: glycosyltransferase [Bacteroidales bacterium]|mgnify:FL=1|nr:glycosyltransferase [Bacteroidales bacterium]MDD4383574.1 glycosyltransferase [Bacteroidales bacterium]MDY0197317.1 glycosyltransferase [Tenuifilaceae bacterium]
MYTKYFTRNNFTPSINLSPDKNLGLCIVLPSYNETELEVALNALANCKKPICSVEVIVVVNYPEGAPAEIVANAMECIKEVEAADRNINNNNFRFLAIPAFNLIKKHAGVGLARRTGMDEAAWRLLKSECDYKIIACFDADSSCSENYLCELEQLWIEKPETAACSIRYEHPTKGDSFLPEIYQAIAQYELHLRYYVDAGRYINHPFSFQTVGSSMACSANTYIKVGGMSKNKAGEDFYFLQKIIPHGNFEELNSAIIFPSPRPSDRVPFGTGRAISKYINEAQQQFQTYNFDSFLGLKPFLETAPSVLFSASKNTIVELHNQQPKPLRDYLEMNGFLQAIQEINSNTAHAETFKKRFFLWFDAFKLLKYLNYANEHYYKRMPICTEATKLAQVLNLNFSTANPSTIELLDTYREYNLRES